MNSQTEELHYACNWIDKERNITEVWHVHDEPCGASICYTITGINDVYVTKYDKFFRQ